MRSRLGAGSWKLFLEDDMHAWKRLPAVLAAVCSLICCGLTASLVAQSATAQKPAASERSESNRPMTFLDVQHMRQAGSPTPSPDGKWLLYTLSTMDWKEAKRQTDIYLVSMQQGVSSTKQMTFTKEKNETSPQWARDNKTFFFLSNREAPESASSRNQLYAMNPDGGEARRVTDAKEGVSNFALSRDGKWLVYRSGKSGEEQLYRLPIDRLESASPEQITKQPAGVGTWQLAPDSKRIYFAGADAADADEKLRREKKFTVNIRNAETPLASLWAVDLDPVKTRRLTEDKTYSVSNFTISEDSKWVGFRGSSANRYERNITQEGLYSDLYILDAASGQIERLTKNREVGENGPSFSPDSRLVAFSAPDDMDKYTMSNGRVYVRAIADRGKPFKKLGTAFDGDVSVGFWSKDGNTIYFNEGIKATNQVLALDVRQGTVRQLTDVKGTISVNQDDTGALLINFADGKTPATTFTVASIDQIASRPAWTQLPDTNPQVRGFALGDQEEITWKSKDGTMVGGVLVKPVGFRAGQRYPLIVAIHGGPASADVLGFNGGYNSQVYAGAGYAVLRPNYRGSTNYGFKHRTDIVG